MYCTAGTYHRLFGPYWVEVATEQVSGVTLFTLAAIGIWLHGWLVGFSRPSKKSAPRSALSGNRTGRPSRCDR
jgi:hypothetical protein